MGNRRISDDIKQLALELWNHGWPLEEICGVLRVSKSSCYRWRQVFEEQDDVNRSPSAPTGRTRLFTKAALMALRSRYMDDTDHFLDKACTWLGVQYGITISPSGLGRNLCEAGLTRNILRKLAEERNEVEREEFKGMLSCCIGDGSEFMVVDRTSKDEHFFIHGGRFSLCAALTVEGYLAAHPIPDSYDDKEFYNFIFEEVFPYMNPFPQPRSILVLDDCHTHQEAELEALIGNSGCLLLFLPPYSPDLTPIKESFNALKACIRRHADQLRQIADPFHLLLEATGYITAENSRNWFKHAGYIVEE